MTSSEKVKYIINITFYIQASEGKRDEFTSYLEKAGVVENLTEVLINLYEEAEKPKFPTEYIKANLKSSSAGENEVIAQNNKLRTENKQLKQRIADLERSIERTKRKIEEKQEQQ